MPRFARQSAPHTQRRPTIDYVRIAVHKNQSQICLCTDAGGVLHPRLPTPRERFVALLSERPKAHMLIEASSERALVAGGRRRWAPLSWPSDRPGISLPVAVHKGARATAATPRAEMGTLPVRGWR